MAKNVDNPVLGRPKADIDWERANELLIAGCSGAEIAGYFGLNANTIYARCLEDNKITFSEYSQPFYSKGESSLREVQYHKAKQGDNMMLIWLGKNRLKQRDKEEDKPANTQYTIKVDRDGIATGISTEMLSASNNKGSE